GEEPLLSSEAQLVEQGLEAEEVGGERLAGGAEGVHRLGELALSGGERADPLGGVEGDVALVLQRLGEPELGLGDGVGGVALLALAVAGDVDELALGVDDALLSLVDALAGAAHRLGVLGAGDPGGVLVEAAVALLELAVGLLLHVVLELGPVALALGRRAVLHDAEEGVARLLQVVQRVALAHRPGDEGVVHVLDLAAGLDARPGEALLGAAGVVLSPGEVALGALLALHRAGGGVGGGLVCAVEAALGGADLPVGAAGLPASLAGVAGLAEALLGLEVAHRPDGIAD